MLHNKFLYLSVIPNMNNSRQLVLWYHIELSSGQVMVTSFASHVHHTKCALYAHNDLDKTTQVQDSSGSFF